jgi:acetylserotonin N-methyltransferase
VLIAHRLSIFEFIALHPCNLTDICAQANVERRRAETLVMALLALKLVDRDGETFSLTPEAETFLLKNNPHYFGYFWDLMVENSEIFSLKNLESAIRKIPRRYTASRNCLKPIRSTPTECGGLPTPCTA